MAKKRTRKSTTSALTTSPVSKANESLEMFLLHKPGPRTRTKTLKRIDALVSEAKRRNAEGDWQDSTGSTFVGLFAMFHKKIYGIVPAELYEKKQLDIASRLAKRCMHNHFDDDPIEVAKFVAWVCKREDGRRDWALREGYDRSPISAFGAFAGKTITQYKTRSRGKRRR